MTQAIYSFGGNYIEKDRLDFSITAGITDSHPRLYYISNFAANDYPSGRNGPGYPGIQQ